MTAFTHSHFTHGFEFSRSLYSTCHMRRRGVQGPSLMYNYRSISNRSVKCEV